MDGVRIDHVGIATNSISQSSIFWKILGFINSGEHIVEEQGVKVRYMDAKEGARIELLEPLRDNTPIANFIKKNGPGIQQIAVSVTNIEEIIEKLKSSGVRMINEKPTKGAGDKLIAFIHPSSTGGVLVELIQG